MKSIAMTVASVLAVAPLAHAQYADGPYRYSDRGDYARVIQSTPVYASTTREVCQDDLTLPRCRVTSERTIEGYDVRYRYRGSEYLTRIPNNPGSTLSLGGDVNSDGTPFDQVASSYVSPYAPPPYTDSYR